MRCSLAVFLVGLSVASARAEPPTVAIIPGTVVNLDAARVDALAQELAGALEAKLEVRAIGGLEVRRRLPEQLPPDCVVSQACVDDVARRLDAQHLLFVVLIDTGAGGAIRVDTIWVDRAGKKTSPRPSISVASITNARARFEDAASALLPDAPRRKQPSRGVSLTPGVARHFTLPSYLTAAATVVGLGVGVSFGLAARGRYNDCVALAANDEPCDASGRSAIRTRALIADAGWLVAIGGAVATSILFATSGSATHVLVEPTSGGVAVMAIGSFR